LILLSSFGVISANIDPIIPTFDQDVTHSLTQITPHSQILIFGDGEFVDQATLEDWPGTGTEEDPYLIEGYSFFGTDSIAIVDTTIHFEVRNCILDFDEPWAGGTNLLLWNVTNAVIADTICSGNSIGLYIVDSSNNLIENNTCLGSSGSMTGIYLEIDVSTSDSNTVANNTCIGYEEAFFISPGCVSNLVQWNVFDGTPFDVNDYNPTPVNNYSFNFYGNYIGTDDNGDAFGDSAYTIAPYYTAVDLYPLMYKPNSPVWLETPINQTIDYGEDINYQMNATAFAPSQWHLNDTLFSVDDEGVVTSRALLQVGVYGLEVIVTNIYGRTLTGRFQITVQDTIAPHWIIEPDDQILLHDEGLDYQLPVTDPSGIDHWAINDTAHFDLSARYYFGGSTARITNKSILEPSSYYLNISVYDMHDNTLSVILLVTILEAPMITTTTTSTTVTTSPTPDGVDPVVTLVLGAGIGGAAVFVLAVVVLKRKS
jgi:parallel beta-helix repeat protein